MQVSNMIKIIQGFNQLLNFHKISIIRWVKGQYVQIHNPHLNIISPVLWSYDNLNSIKISSNVCIGPFSEIIAYSHVKESKVLGCLIIEENVIVGSHANIRAAGGKIFIGRNSMLAQHISLIAANHTISSDLLYRELNWDESKTGIHIDENVWIGTGVTILPGCSIGKNSVIGAGSVVTKNVPESEIWAGIPAKKLRSIFINK
jgi:acetyltransferase-like isoleucine patch superfamily enzyme